MALRPTSITVIGWIMIVSGMFSLSGMLRFTESPQMQKIMEQSPLPTEVQRLLPFLNTIVDLIGGYFLLKGRNWARYLCAIWPLVQLSLAFYVSPYRLPLALGFVVNLLIIYFLFRHTANVFFAAVGAGSKIENTMSWRQIASNCFYVLAGFFLAGISLIAFAGVDGGWAKSFVLASFSVPALVLLGIGKALSADPRWKRQIGIVLAASALAGAMLMLTVTLVFMNPEFIKNLPQEKVAGFRDYTTGLLWIVTLAGLGGLAIFLERQATSRTDE